MKGWVYIITNKAMPNLLKVGFSTKDPELRAQELHTTGVPHRFVVEYDVLVNEPTDIEQAAHNLLKNYHENKEWFNCSIETAVMAIRQSAANNILLENCRFNNFSEIRKEIKNKIIPQQIIIRKRFTVQNGIAKDTANGLIWLRFAHGQTWKNNIAVCDVKAVVWKDAFEVAKRFNQQGGYGGYTDWRLPTIDELKTLIDKVKGVSGNYIDADVFSNNEGR
ncbi:MAG: DUF1566 domain-containing protein [Methylococcales bacterium]|nr:DUF1566 domain-containing protein [Methylococcales bacterium]